MPNQIERVDREQIVEAQSVIASAILGPVTTHWTVERLEDVNGYAKADILWRHTSGAVSFWFMNTALVSSGRRC